MKSGKKEEIVKKDEPLILDPFEIFSRTPLFIIMKNGVTVPLKSGEKNLTDQGRKIVIEAPKCTGCGKVRTEHGPLHQGLCTSCQVKDIHLEPMNEPDVDTCKFTGSGMFSAAEYQHAHTGSSAGGFLTFILHKDNVRLVYIDVPHRVWLELLAAPSPGKFYNQMIKGKYLQQENPQTRKAMENQHDAKEKTHSRV